jgi:hypothetical protein
MVTPYLPFVEGRSDADFRWRLGVRPLDLADWIEWGPDADDLIALKVILNVEHPDTVFAVLDGIEAESRCVADALVEHLAAYHPDRPRRLDPNLHPLDAAARLVPEDLVMMVERPGPDGPQLVFGGGSVCFPNRWDLRSKLGLTMAEVHAPVAQLNAQLEAPVDRFFDRLTPDRSYWRLGWGLLDTANPYTPLDGTAATRPTNPRPAEMFLRVERETLRRFVPGRCVVFTIRTHIARLDDAVADPQARARLAAALETMPGDVLEYKDLRGAAGRLIEHLGGRRAPGGLPPQG